MKLNQLSTPMLNEQTNLGSIYLKGVKQTGVLKSFKGNFAIPKGLEDEVVAETVRLIKAGFVAKKNLWWQFDNARSNMKLKGDVNNLLSYIALIRKIAGEAAPASTVEIAKAGFAMQAAIESYSTLYGGVYKCKQVLDELAGLALKRYPMNNNERDVAEQVSFIATITLKGLGVWKEYQEALANGQSI
jgi:hypothetical protein